MAKKRNPLNSNFDNIFDYNNTSPTAIEQTHQADAKALAKANKKKTHVSVLLSEPDFEYVRDRCYELRISKNEFFKRLLDDYRREH